MEQNEWKNVLAALEADNVAELNSRTGEHRFPKSFERRAISVCRGTAAACRSPRRHRRAFVRTCDRMRRCGIQILYQIYTQLRHCRYVQRCQNVRDRRND